VDQFSGLSFVHLQKTSSGEETLDAKMAFEGFAHSLNVQIQHYHADNRRFCENLWMNNVRKEGQTISFCSVNVHFQNGVAERRIRDLSDGARTSLLHAKEQWSKAISVHLWPYAVRHRNEVYNATRKESRKASPIKLFSNMTIQPRLKHFHAFGCPTYRLNRGLQGGKSQPKWEQRAQPVIYLRSLPKHASSVALVLDLLTAHVSPQYHLKFDDLFETVSPSGTNSQAHQSSWQQLCHFGKGKQIKTRRTEAATITPRQGNVSDHANSPTKPPGNTDATIIQAPLPPVDTFDVAQDKGVASAGVASEGVMPGEEHLPTPPVAVENVVERKSG
jgi:hypothetical protein